MKSLQWKTADTTLAVGDTVSYHNVNLWLWRRRGKVEALNVPEEARNSGTIIGGDIMVRWEAYQDLPELVSVEDRNNLIVWL
ncbi:MAG: hypothetical protein OEX12_06165 [Gammaproteobacteria bacterium]|nr:hypothetical protein [Gammaproteobacteria bacterium]